MNTCIPLILARECVHDNQKIVIKYRKGKQKLGGVLVSEGFRKRGELRSCHRDREISFFVFTI